MPLLEVKIRLIYRGTLVSDTSLKVTAPVDEAITGRRYSTSNGAIFTEHQSTN